MIETPKPYKQRTPLFALYSTMLVSVTGDAMAAIAIPWFVLQTTGSAAQTGITAFFSVSPIILGMFFGGAIVDRIGYKRVSVAADLASGVTTLLIPLFYYTIGLEFWQLLVLVFLGNLLDAPGRSAKRSMLPDLASTADMDIDRASGLMESVSRATGMIGAPLAGLLIVTIGAAGVLWVDAVTFFISAIGIFAFVPSRLVEAQTAPQTSYLDDLRAGFRFVRRDSLILTFIIVVMVTNTIDIALSSVTYPVYAEQVFGAESGAVNLGLIVGVFGGSALVGTLLYTWIGSRFSRRRIFTFGFLQVGVLLLFLALLPPFWALLVAVAISGVFAGPLNPIVNAVMYNRTPSHMRARVLGLLSAGVAATMPLGGLFAGFLQESVGLQSTLLIYAVVYFLISSTLLFNPAVRRIDQVALASADAHGDP